MPPPAPVPTLHSLQIKASHLIVLSLRQHGAARIKRWREKSQPHVEVITFYSPSSGRTAGGPHARWRYSPAVGFVSLPLYGVDAVSALVHAKVSEHLQGHVQVKARVRNDSGLNGGNPERHGTSFHVQHTCTEATLQPGEVMQK